MINASPSLLRAMRRVRENKSKTFIARNESIIVDFNSIVTQSIYINIDGPKWPNERTEMT